LIFKFWFRLVRACALSCSQKAEYPPAGLCQGVVLQTKKNKVLTARLTGEQKGITGLETAIMLIAFVVVAVVFAQSVLSAGLFSADKSREAVLSGLDQVQCTLEIRGNIIGFRDTLNAGGKGSLGKVEVTVNTFTSRSETDLTPAYTIVPGSGALINSNPGANSLQIAFADQQIAIPDCAWTVEWTGKSNHNNILDSDEKAVITVWLHTFDGANWGPAGSELPPFLGAHYVDTYHTFTLEVKSASGATLNIEKTTPGYLDPVVDLR
jgi:archaeal flagellin FlaB